MISIDRSLSETWVIINSPSPQRKENRERVEFLNFQLQNLINNIPTEEFTPLEPALYSPKWLRVGLKLFCRLRVHHIKMLNYVGSFDSIRDLISQPQSARVLVTSAAEAVIIALEMMNNNGGKTSPLLLPSAFKFLLSSLSFILLVVSHYPTQYRAMCSKPFHAAIGMLKKMQGIVKDPSLDICGAIQELQKIAEAIQLLPPPPPSSPPPPEESAASFLLADSKHETNNSVRLSQTYAGPNVFDELQTPDADFFTNLGDVNISAPDLLYMNMNNMFE